MTHRSHSLQDARVRSTLARERQMMSLIEREILSGTDTLVIHSENWVKMWVDTGNVVTSDCGTMRAERGITRDGQLLWLVSREGKAKAYHATAADPFAAFEQAGAALDRRREVRSRWDEVRRLSRRLLLGSVRFDVLIADADASPLCSVGIRAFLRRIGMGGVTRVSGRTAALMMLLEPQVGFVIYEAALRHGALPDARDAGPLATREGLPA
ncbi:hypothetical protein [Pseudaestuariivita sp.]|uniref:hypothetical protein n=1 Tax=Pseudaestuariivita sp. TaxID=2211669 RepID=UPI0040588891